VDQIGDWVWVKLTAPSLDEVEAVASRLSGVDPADIAAANDPEEKSRVVYEKDFSFVLIDIPVDEVRHGVSTFDTIPLGIIVCERNVITVCAQDTPILTPGRVGSGQELSTRERRRFLYRILLRAALLYQRDLRSIDRQRRDFEEKIKRDTTEKDLMSLHEVETTLVYFATSLRGNGSVLARLQRSGRLHPGQSTEDLLDDAATETQQAIEMAQIYRDIMDGTRNLLSSLMDSRLNNVMERLTSITLILSIPTVISGLYGMNVDLSWMPLAQVPHGFGIIGGTAIVCVVLSVILVRRGWM
jgi:magnesium transporter